RGRDELDREVPVTDGVQAVAGHAAEAELLGDRGAVDGEGRRRERARAERRLVGSLGRVDDPAAVALEHVHVGQEVVRQPDRLRPLQVRVPGRQRVDVLARLLEQRARGGSGVWEGGRREGAGGAGGGGGATVVWGRRGGGGAAPASPMRSVSRASTFMWMSSSSASSPSRPSRRSFSTSRRPAMMRS